MQNDINKHPVEKIIEVCQRINNGRNISSVFGALVDEVDELKDEINKMINGEEPGEDGIVGEAIDVMLCAVDIIYQRNPSISKEQLSYMVGVKLAKWELLYSNPETTV